MIEINESPFIKDKEYLLTHDLCDIPGLFEFQMDTTQNEKIEEMDKENFIKEAKQIYLKYDEEEKKEENIEEKEKNIEKDFEKVEKDEEENNNKEKNKNEREDDIYYNIKIEENIFK